MTSCYESAVFCICLFLSTEAEVLDSFQKKCSELLDYTDLQATESRAEPREVGQGTCVLTQAPKAMKLDVLFQ